MCTMNFRTRGVIYFKISIANNNFTLILVEDSDNDEQQNFEDALTHQHNSGNSS